VYIFTKPLNIKSNPKNIFKELLDFDKYKIHNPFHRYAKLVIENNEYFIEFKCSNPPSLGGKLKVDINIPYDDENLDINKEKICYVDYERFIFIYCVDAYTFSSIRCIWIEGNDESSIIKSWHTVDGIGGLAIKYSFNSVEYLTDGFQKQFEGLKNYIENNIKEFKLI
jgi:hypothetical protein